jgi:hypothetical protein
MRSPVRKDLPSFDAVVASLLIVYCDNLSWGRDCCWNIQQMTALTKWILDATIHVLQYVAVRLRSIGFGTVKSGVPLRRPADMLLGV